jgi:adenylate kinase family enzyme
MKRIMVIGCCGAGKSTFSKALHNKLKLPLIHLDQHYWKPNWTETDPVAWAQKVEELAQNEDWIIDGNYGGTMGIRLAKADTIFYLDISTAKALYRILKRSYTYLGETRPDMPSGCPERISWEFIHYVFNFNRTRRDKIFQKLKLHSKNKTIHILKSEKAIHDFLLTFEP